MWHFKQLKVHLLYFFWSFQKYSTAFFSRCHWVKELPYALLTSLKFCNLAADLNYSNLGLNDTQVRSHKNCHKSEFVASILYSSSPASSSCILGSYENKWYKINRFYAHQPYHLPNLHGNINHPSILTWCFCPISNSSPTHWNHCDFQELGYYRVVKWEKLHVHIQYYVLSPVDQSSFFGLKKTWSHIWVLDRLISIWIFMPF